MSNSGDEFYGKRQRVSRACDLCRRKKIKCDGGTPVCGNCVALGLSCSYKDTTKKRGPPKGYIEAVENRLHKLEEVLREISLERDDPRSRALLAELDAPLETNTGELISTRPVRRPPKEDSNKKSNSPKESPMSLSQICFTESPRPTAFADSTPSSPDSAGDSTGQLSMDETGQVRYLGKSSGYYLLQNSRTYQNGAFHFSGYGHKHMIRPDPRRKAVPPIDPYELPPKDLSESLLKLYFAHFYPFLPLFYKRRLASTLTSPLEPVSPLLLNAVYAVASRISDDPRVRADPQVSDTAGEIFFERAKYLLEDNYDVPRISTVQALLLLSTYQHGTMKYVRAWLYSGMAFRMAQDLGLNRNCEHWNIPPAERERRKRVFWCCFIVDRLTSAIYGRSSMFEERDCDVPFPTVDDDDEDGASAVDADQPKPRVLESFVHLIKICDILGHVLRNTYYAKARHHASPQHLEHVLSGLNRELSNWYSNLPPSLQYKLPNTESGEMVRDPPLPVSQMHMIYYTTIILLHRPFIPAGPASSLSLPSYKMCVSAATSILNIVNVMMSEKHLKYVLNWAVYCIFTAGIVFIKMASSDEMDKVFDAKIYINKIMRALDEIETVWMNAARCCNILGELAGLRDINLECNEREKRRTTPPPSIAVPNSPEISVQDRQRAGDDFLPQQPASCDSRFDGFPGRSYYGSSQGVGELLGLRTNGSDLFSTSALFETGQTGSSQQNQQYDPLHTAFWGVPPSMDVEEWNNYFGTMSNPQQQQQHHQQQQQQQQQPSIPPARANAGVPGMVPSAPLIPSHEFSPVQALRSGSAAASRQAAPQPEQQQHGGPLLHNDQKLDILAGSSLDLPSPSRSVLLGLLSEPQDDERHN